MNVAINALPIRQLWGSSAETYLCGLLPELVGSDPNAEFVVFLRNTTEWPAELEFPNLRLQRLPVFGPAVARILVEQFHLPSRSRAFDLLFCPYNTVPRSVTVPCVVYLHSFLWFTHPHLSSATRNLFFRGLVPRSVARAAAVLCPTEATARDIAHHLHVAAERLHVVPHGYSSLFRPGVQPGDDAFLNRFGVRQPYVLSVTSIAKHKDLHRLVEAFSRVRQYDTALQLVMVGTEAGKAYSGELRKSIAARGLEDSIRIIPPVGAAELRAMYANAKVFVLASQCETFGLPALEAMACGCPVVASDIPALREVTATASILVDTTDVAQFAAVLSKVLNDPAEHARRTAASIERASHFGWRKAAQKMLPIFRQVAGVDARMAGTRHL